MYPQPFTLIDADVVVAPLPGSPEEVMYREPLSLYNGPVIVERDPYTALSRALSHPRSMFTRLIAGVDPGRECGLAILADGIVVALSRVPCEDLGERIINYTKHYPSNKVETYIGDGHGFSRAVASIEGRGIPYSIVDERGTTKTLAYAGLFSLIKDRDLLASLAIALKGAYGSGRIAAKVRGTNRL